MAWRESRKMKKISLEEAKINEMAKMAKAAKMASLAANHRNESVMAASISGSGMAAAGISEENNQRRRRNPAISM
jgi:uncharacterized protein (UPF0210 family)